MRWHNAMVYYAMYGIIVSLLVEPLERLTILPKGERKGGGDGWEKCRRSRQTETERCRRAKRDAETEPIGANRRRSGPACRPGSRPPPCARARAGCRHARQSNNKDTDRHMFEKTARDGRDDDLTPHPPRRASTSTSAARPSTTRGGPGGGGEALSERLAEHGRKPHIKLYCKTRHIPGLNLLVDA